MVNMKRVFALFNVSITHTDKYNLFVKHVQINRKSNISAWRSSSHMGGQALLKQGREITAKNLTVLR